MALCARFSLICRIRAGFVSPFLAGKSIYKGVKFEDLRVRIRDSVKVVSGEVLKERMIEHVSIGVDPINKGLGLVRREGRDSEGFC
jgi:ribulose 1,5-bisphosphate synthetase/thiazole synthase